MGEGSKLVVAGLSFATDEDCGLNWGGRIGFEINNGFAWLVAEEAWARLWFLSDYPRSATAFHSFSHEGVSWP